MCARRTPIDRLGPDLLRFSVRPGNTFTRLKNRNDPTPATVGRPRLRDGRRRNVVAMVGIKNDRDVLEHMAAESLAGGERVLAMLPYAHVPARPKGPAGKVRDGIYQSFRRYRPIVLTDRRVLVFDTGRTHLPRSLLAEFPNADVEVVSVTPGSMGKVRLLLELPEVGQVPFETGRREQDDLAVLVETLGGA